jgi:hypothetical protein
VGDLNPELANIEISQTAVADDLNDKLYRFGQNEWTRLFICQHPNVVPMYGFAYTDKGNLFILIALAECDFKSYYEGIIEENPPPALSAKVQKWIKKTNPDA